MVGKQNFNKNNKDNHLDQSKTQVNKKGVNKSTSENNERNSGGNDKDNNSDQSKNQDNKNDVNNSTSENNERTSGGNNIDIWIIGGVLVFICVILILIVLSSKNKKGYPQDSIVVQNKVKNNKQEKLEIGEYF